MDINPKSKVNQNQYVDNDADRADLKEKSLRSGLITFGAQPIKLAIGIGSTAILARLLTPADFGLLAMVSPLLLLADSLSNLGMETATVHKEKLEHTLLSAIFWLSLGVNVVVFGLMVLIAPILAWFYKEARLTEVTLVLAVGFLSQCLTFQHKSLLKRQMRFGTLTAIDVASLFIGNGCALLVAWLGFSYWALVLQVVIVQFIQSIACWFVCDWRPARYSSYFLTLDANLRSMFAYGGHLTAFRVFTRLSKRLDRILIGYFSGARALGLYDVAYRWAYFAFELVYMPLFDVAVSSFSRVQHDPDLYRAYCRRGLMPIFALCMPALAFSFVEAREVILLLLGNQWLEAVPIFQLLTVAVFFNSTDRVTKWLYVSEGQTQRQFHWSLISTPVMICALAVGATWGAYGISMGYTVATCLLAYPSITYCLKTSPVSISDFNSAVVPSALASVAGGIVLFASRFVLPNTTNIVLNLLLKLTVFAITYFSIWLLFPSSREVKTEILIKLKQLILKLKKLTKQKDE
ncbi:polysaccharide biosynthesis protein [Calothrix sp. NIES-4071]|nr:polysaccharide biosynthesis protein [Calothrix sp. NIES-4071]BAZ55190.1 polysaccharide biosynthesis protein [Calothrix sp. NIES-4105]